MDNKKPKYRVEDITVAEDFESPYTISHIVDIMNMLESTRQDIILQGTDRVICSMFESDIRYIEEVTNRSVYEVTIDYVKSLSATKDFEDGWAIVCEKYEDPIEMLGEDIFDYIVALYRENKNDDK